jgi:hypothetical protein
MAKQLVQIGASANDGTGDQLRTAFDKINDNFNEIYAGIAPVARATAPAAALGSTGDVAGMVAFDTDYVYICTANYDGANPIWNRAAFLTWV